VGDAPFLARIAFPERPLFADHAETLGTSEDRAAWLSRRRLGFGASQAAAIVGKDPTRGPLAVYAEHVGAEMPDISERPEIRLGLAVEGAVIGLYSEQTGRPVAPNRGVHLRSRVEPLMLATLDATTEIERVVVPLEIKTTAVWRSDDWENGAPPRPWWQAQAQCFVTGARRASVAALIWPRVVWCDVERDDAAIGHLLRCARELWARIENRDPPPPDMTGSTRDALRALYPADDGSTVVLPGALIEISDRLDVAKAARRELEKQIERDEAEIKAALGTATLGILPDRSSWSWKQQHTRESVRAASTSRVLRRHAAKGL